VRALIGIVTSTIGTASRSPAQRPRAPDPEPRRAVDTLDAEYPLPCRVARQRPTAGLV